MCFKHNNRDAGIIVWCAVVFQTVWSLCEVLQVLVALTLVGNIDGPPKTCQQCRAWYMERPDVWIVSFLEVGRGRDLKRIISIVSVMDNQKMLQMQNILIILRCFASVTSCDWLS